MPSDFTLREVEIPAHGLGSSWSRTSASLSRTPDMRVRMSAKKSCIEPYAVGEPMDGSAVGRVLASNAEASSLATA